MKSLVIYFSRADENYFGGKMRYIAKGNTEVVAEFIGRLTGADLWKVERAKDYAKDYATCIREAQEEQGRDKLPALKAYLEGLDGYDVVYIGGPIYWGTLPQPVFTQLARLDFEGKIVMPFSTHEGSGLGSVVKDLKRVCKGADVRRGLAIVGSSVQSAMPTVDKWIKENLQ